MIYIDKSKIPSVDFLLKRNLNSYIEFIISLKSVLESAELSNKTRMFLNSSHNQLFVSIELTNFKETNFKSSPIISIFYPVDNKHGKLVLLGLKLSNNLFYIGEKANIKGDLNSIEGCEEILGFMLSNYSNLMRKKTTMYRTKIDKAEASLLVSNIFNKRLLPFRHFKTINTGLNSLTDNKGKDKVRLLDLYFLFSEVAKESLSVRKQMLLFQNLHTFFAVKL